VGHFLLHADLLSQIKSAVLGSDLLGVQQQGEDVDKPLQVALWDKADRSAAYKTQEHEKGLKKKVLKT